MKIIITESQYKNLREQKLNFPDIKQMSRVSSDYLGKGGGFERANQMTQGDIQRQIEFLKKVPTNTIKKVALVFPKRVWYEELGVRIMNALGVISGWFRSLSEALGYVGELRKKGVKTDQLVIGSHGGGEELLITQQEGLFKFDNKFLLDLKGIIHTNSTVFFTACHGADHLTVLKNAAETLGIGAYGAQGVYNYATNSAENGFYWCSAQPVNPNLMKSNQDKMQPLKWLDTMGEVEIRVPFPGFKSGYGNVTGTLNFKGNKVFGLTVAPIPFTAELGIALSDDVMKQNAPEVLKYKINPRNLLENYVDQISRQQNRNIWGPTSREMEKQGVKVYESKVYADMLNDNTMTITLNLPTGKTDVKSLKEIGLSKTLSNDFLLKSKYCKKVNQAPINWVNEVLEKISSPLTNIFKT